MAHILIIGNGISGVTLARHIRQQSQHDITIVSDESEYFFSRTALMYVFMGTMKWEHIEPYESFFWRKNRINLVNDRAVGFDFKQKTCATRHGKILRYDVLVFAVGSKPNQVGCSGENLAGVHGFYSKQDLETISLTGKRIKESVIIGGGLIGVELAEMMKYQHSKVTMLIREPHYWGNVLPEKDGKFVGRFIEKQGIDVLYNTTVKLFEGDENRRISTVVTDQNQRINANFAGIAVGVIPNIDFLRNTSITVSRGILVNTFFETNIDNVYAIGDCAEFSDPLPGRKKIEQVWYTGRMMGETLAKTICGKRTAYQPGHWFNSARFFEMEYQTYGVVPSQIENDLADFFWSNSSGEKAIHFVWEKSTGLLMGVNAFGMRLRHEIFDHWLTIKTEIGAVIENLENASFDPELYRSVSDEILSNFNIATGKNCKPAAKTWWKHLLK